MPRKEMFFPFLILVVVKKLIAIHTLEYFQEVFTSLMFMELKEEELTIHQKMMVNFNMAVLEDIQQVFLKTPMKFQYTLELVQQA